MITKYKVIYNSESEGYDIELRTYASETAKFFILPSGNRLQKTTAYYNSFEEAREDMIRRLSDANLDFIERCARNNRAIIKLQALKSASKSPTQSAASPEEAK